MEYMPAGSWVAAVVYVAVPPVSVPVPRFFFPALGGFSHHSELQQQHLLCGIEFDHRRVSHTGSEKRNEGGFLQLEVNDCAGCEFLVEVQLCAGRLQSQGEYTGFLARRQHFFRRKGRREPSRDLRRDRLQSRRPHGKHRSEGGPFCSSRTHRQLQSVEHFNHRCNGIDRDGGFRRRPWYLSHHHFGEPGQYHAHSNPVACSSVGADNDAYDTDPAACRSGGHWNLNVATLAR